MSVRKDCETGDEGQNVLDKGPCLRFFAPFFSVSLCSAHKLPAIPVYRYDKDVWALMTEPQEQAALLVAQGRLSQRVIAKRVEISKRTLTYWQLEPEFRETVARHRDAFRKAAEQQREEISKHGLALKLERIFQKMRRHAYLRRIQRARSKDERILCYLGKDLGLAAGLFCVRYKGKDADREEFALDTRMLAEFNQLEKDIAIEVGDWKAKREISVPPEPPSERVLTLAKLPYDLLKALEAQFEIQNQTGTPQEPAA